MEPAERPREPASTNPEFGSALRQASILVVDDEPGIRNFLMRTLGPRSRLVEEAGNADEASRKMDRQHYDVVIVDNVMPGKTGIQWLAEQRALGFYSDAILITAYADLETAIEALRVGASDFVLKPFRSNQILNAVARCLDRQHLRRENFVLRQELRANGDGTARRKLIGQSAAISAVREAIARVAPLPSSVLLTGESGTGKEVAARVLHDMSERADKSFVPVNCAAMPPEMIESELFGHLKGSFTGAAAARDGLFVHAGGGTLFLDEIGELPAAMQGKLLRVLEERRVRPIGAEREIPVDVRLVFATNRDLELDVRAGRFRADLYYRINVMQIRLPPLRERREDIEELALQFVKTLSRQLGVPAILFDAAAREALRSYRWPGNIRELRNVIERSLILGRFANDLPQAEAASGEEERLEGVERRHILAMLEQTGFDRAETARRLGVSRKTIDRKCAQWNVGTG
ncbi:sigma-54 dependent transcriptional regulator [Ancylobacter oerskovii]|uniref:Sigma-54-dependent transcriptional regulator n=1 Tax=Ancylobacter oerskovii TaxID=459519 RepID=A0ABW4Z2K7_9HYPH